MRTSQVSSPPRDQVARSEGCQLLLRPSAVGTGYEVELFSQVGLLPFDIPGTPFSTWNVNQQSTGWGRPTVTAIAKEPRMDRAFNCRIIAPVPYLVSHVAEHKLDHLLARHTNGVNAGAGPKCGPTHRDCFLSRTGRFSANSQQWLESAPPFWRGRHRDDGVVCVQGAVDGPGRHRSGA
jgi:hypothetical protein